MIYAVTQNFELEHITIHVDAIIMITVPNRITGSLTDLYLTSTKQHCQNMSMTSARQILTSPAVNNFSKLITAFQAPPSYYLC